MKRDKDTRDEEKTGSDNRRNSEDSEQADSNGADKRTKLDTSLNLKDLGAGYDPEERKVVRAINTYETKLLPYIEQNSSIFRKSNFLTLRGYAVGLLSADNTAATRND